MNAITFFKSMGLKAVKQFLENDNIRTREMHDELKQIVEAFELVDQCGGLSRAKSELKLLMDSLSIGLYHGIEGTCAEMKIPRLKKAINLVEQCQ